MKSHSSVSALSSVSFEDHCNRFKSHFTACLGMAYSRASVDRFGSHMDKCRRHLAIAIQSLEVIDSRGFKPAAGDYLKFNKEHKTTGNFEVSLQELVASSVMTQITLLDDSITQAVLTLMSLLDVIVKKNNVAKLVEGFRWDLAVKGSTENKSVNIALYLERYVHSIQTVPGLCDSLRLLFGLMSTLLSSDVLTDASSLLISPRKLLVSSRVVSFFLGWLRSNSIFWMFSLVDKTTWSQLENSLLIYIQLLPRVSNADSYQFHRMDCSLVEGFLPLSEMVGDFLEISFSHIFCRCSHCQSFPGQTEEHNLHKSYSTDVVFQRIDSCRQITRSLSREALSVVRKEDAKNIVNFDANRRPVDPNDGNFPHAGSSFLTVLNFSSADAADTADSAESATSRDVFQFLTVSKSLDDEDDSDVSDDVIVLCAAPEKSIQGRDPSQTVGSIFLQKKEHSSKTMKEQDQKGKARQCTVSQLRQTPVLHSQKSDHIPTIVIDAANVAMRHGLNSKFSCKGIKLAMDFFHRMGHKVVGFIPVSIVSVIISIIV